MPLSVRQCIAQGAEQFEQNDLYFGHGSDNPWDEAAILLLWALELDWVQLESSLSLILEDSQIEKIEQLYRERITRRVPSAYLTGEAWFAGHRFEVNEHVLVPRSPIAELINAKFQPWLAHRPMKILDLCCGSGCIGIACAFQFPQASVVLADISVEALKVARRNISLYQLGDRVTALQSDGFLNINGQFDLIVSNPPYVDAEDLAAMPAEYHAEPEIGLYSGEDGLDLTRQILRQAGGFLTTRGSLIVEVGNSAQALESLLPKVSFIWPEFEFGGHGVFTLSAEDLEQFKDEIKVI